MNNNSIFKDHNLPIFEKDVDSLILSLILSGVARCERDSVGQTFVFMPSTVKGVYADPDASY